MTLHISKIVIGDACPTISCDDKAASEDKFEILLAIQGNSIATTVNLKVV